MFCFESFYGDEEGVWGDVGGVVGGDHEGDIDHGGDAEADEPGVLVEEVECGEEEADEGEGDSCGEGDEGRGG